MTFRGILFDLDGTLTPVRSSWQFLHERLGLWSGRAEAHQRLFLDGRISYEEFCLRDAAEWRGLEEERLLRAARSIPYRPGVDTLLAAVRSAGLRTGIVSTGLTVLSERVRREKALDYALANHLEIDDGRVSGRVDVKVVHGRKGEGVHDFCRSFGIAPSEVIAVGDSEGDISMFRACGYAVAVDPSSDQVAASADAVHSGPDLAALAAALPFR